jgi:heme exporter protein C
MGLVQKIFYFHMPPAMLMLLSAIFCGIVSAIFLVRRRPFYDWMAFAAAELTVLYGAMAMVTGPLWARKRGASGGCGTRGCTMSLLMWMVFVSYLLLRRYGGPGSETLAAGLALFGMATAPFVYYR